MASSLAQRLVEQSEAAWNAWVDRLTVRAQQELERFEAEPSGNEKPKWLLFLIPELDDARVETYERPEDLAAYLKTRIDERGLRIFVFYGFPAHVSKKPLRYLVHPNGTTYPLFDLPAELEIQEDGLMGPDPEEEHPSTIGQDFEEERVEAEWDDLADAPAEGADDEDASDEDEDEDDDSSEDPDA